MNITFNKSNNVWKMAIIMVAIFCMFAFFVPTDVAFAEEIGWEEGYNDYLSELGKDDAGDWYFGDDYLNVEGASLIIDAFLRDDAFDKNALKEDPIVIAIIDSGIGYAYTKVGGEEIEPNPLLIYEDEVEYKLHPIFEDVILTDDEGNYIYKNVVDELKIKDKGNGQIMTTMTDIPQNEGNIALDMVDNTSDNHGTHVTGIVAMLIHKLGLEDYIKILPVKANTTLNYNIERDSYTAGYNINYLNTAMDFCRENGADIVSLSLTAYNQGDDSGYMFAEYVDDMLLVAAAGNNGDTTKGYPACADKVLGVMNHTIDAVGNPVLADSSNHGQYLNGKHYYDISAPGTGIISSINGEEYGKLTGTSMATPITAFATALGYLRYRGYNNYDYGYALNSLSVSTMISHGVNKMATKRETVFTYSYPVLTLPHILTYDFYGDVEFLTKIGETPEIGDSLQSIDIIDLSNAQYKIGGGDTITLIANPTPANALKEDALKWWCEMGDEKVLIGEGWNIEYAIPEEVGAYRIYCATVNDEGEEVIVSTNQINFEVVYRTPNELEIVNNNTAFAIDETYTFYVNTQFVNPDVNLDIEWYVNGEKMGEGNRFLFTPKDLDDYTITLKINGVEVDRVQFTTYTEDGWVLFMGAVMMIITVVINVLGLRFILPIKASIELLALIIVLVVFAVKKRKSKNPEKE